MAVIVRPVTVYLLLAVFVTVSAAGVGLHALPVADHFHADFGGHRHGCGCGHGDHRSDTNSESVPESNEDCSICRFLAQNIQLALPVTFEFSIRRVFLCSPRVHSLVPVRPRLSYNTRAPPAKTVADLF